MRWNATVASVICAAGFAAALGTHALLEALAACGAGAATFEQHAHGAVSAVVVVEFALLFSLVCAAVREYRASSVAIAFDARLRVGSAHVVVLGVSISSIAVATLWGMEMSESPRAALGLGWLGGSLIPGGPVLALTILAALALIKLVLDGRAAGLDRLIAFLSGVLLAVERICRVRPFAVRRTAQCLVVRTSALGRSGGLRAPPRSHF